MIFLRLNRSQWRIDGVKKITDNSQGGSTPSVTLTVPESLEDQRMTAMNTQSFPDLSNVLCVHDQSFVSNSKEDWQATWSHRWVSRGL